MSFYGRGSYLDMVKFDLFPFSGHGSCINSRCDCNEDFTGGACECTRDNSTCLRSGDEESGVLCSGMGECVCGVCICNDYGLTFGQYCEECVVSSFDIIVLHDMTILCYLFSLSHTHIDTQFIPPCVHTALPHILFTGIYVCGMQCAWQLPAVSM